ncbi:hypothetical protein GWI33_020468 [Rhynchophorus ferrugineus]|uniref:Uncharacterized protein n=1 Tax=Rhynchophorus ferrugineus TaxID=354439 RepID=A0A834I3B6_RHYFE|nr:hypothetical protein GWI33_020468 [Rhynchophorus ferrugineus]
MHLGVFGFVVATILAVANAQFPQFPPQFPGTPLQPFQSFGPGPVHRGSYQHHAPPPPPPHGNPYENIYNTEGQKLTCRMVCSPAEVEDVESVSNKKLEKKDSNENKLDKE